jgi:hypothetical protein
MISISNNQEVIGRPVFLSPNLPHLLLQVRVVFAFHFFFGSALHVEQDILIGSIAPAAPHLLAWCVSFQTPIEIVTKDSSRPLPVGPTLCTVAFPGRTF